MVQPMGADVDESNPSQHEEAGEEGCNPTQHEEAEEEGCHPTQHEEDACCPTEREEGGGRLWPNMRRRSVNQHDDGGNCSTMVTRQR